VIGIVALSSIAILLTRQAPPVVDLPSPVTALGPSHRIAVHVRDPHGVRRLEAFVEQERHSVSSLGERANIHDGLMTTWSFVPARTRLLSSKTAGEINRRSCLERVASEDSTLGARRESGERDHPSSVLIQTNIICIWAWLI